MLTRLLATLVFGVLSATSALAQCNDFERPCDGHTPRCERVPVFGGYDDRVTICVDGCEVSLPYYRREPGAGSDGAYRVSCAEINGLQQKGFCGTGGEGYVKIDDTWVYGTVTCHDGDVCKVVDENLGIFACESN